MKLPAALKAFPFLLFSFLTIAHAQDPNLIWEKEEGLSVVEFSPDGKWLMTHGSRPEDIVFRDIANGEVVRTFPHPEDVLEAKFSPDGKFIAAGVGGDIMIWSIKENKIIHTLKDSDNHYNKSAFYLDFSEDGRYLAQGSYGLPDGLEFENNVYVWDVQEGKLVWKDRKFIGQAKVQFVRGTPYLYVTTSPNYQAGLYDAMTGEFVKDASPRRFYSPDGKLYAVEELNIAGYKDISIRTADSDKQKTFIKANMFLIGGQAFVMEKNLFIFSFSIGGNSAQSSTQVWNFETANFIKYHSLLDKIAVSPNSQYIATSYHSKTQLYKANWEPTSISESQKEAHNLAATPNPAREQVTISFTLSSLQNVSCSIVSLTGETVATLLKSQFIEGKQHFTWQFGGAAQGMYFVQLCVGGHVQTQPIFITR